MSVNFTPEMVTVYVYQSPARRRAKQLSSVFIHNIQVEQHDGIVSTVVARKMKSVATDKAHEQLADEWEQNPLHSKYGARIKQADADQKHIHQWLGSSGLKTESEGFILAAHD